MPPGVESLCQSYLDLRWHFDPAAAPAAGAEGFDARLGSFDAESMGEHLAALTAIALAVEEAEADTVPDEIDRTALLDDIRTMLFRFDIEQPHVRDPAFWLSHLFRALHQLLLRPGVSAEARARDATERLRATPAFLAAAEATLKQPPSVFLETALGMVAGGSQLIAEVVRVLGGAAPGRAAELDPAAAGAEAALARFESVLQTELRAHPDALSFAIGEDQFNRRLHHQHALRNTAPELWRYGLHLVEEVAADVAALARTIDASVHWRDLVGRLRDEVPAAGDLLSAYRAEVDRARGFVEQHDLAALPSGALQVVTTPPFLRPLVPIAAYTAPGPLMADRTGYFYVTEPSDPAQVRREHCRGELAATAVHETYPGHHLSRLTWQAQPSLVRRHLGTPLTIEGWALYCEDLMAELGYYRTPEERLMQLVHLLWRAVRVMLDVGLHTRGMTPEQAVDQLMHYLPMDRRDAEAEVRRYCAWPAYQLSYAVGRREILRLREACQARDGAAFSLRAFHDEFLSYGALPVSLIRWGMGLDE